jgi:hypothetical protein
MSLVHQNALLRADFNTVAADDAGVPVQGPGLRRPRNLKRIGWAALLAGAAENALLNVNVDMAAGSGNRNVLLLRIPAGIRAREELGEYASGKVNHG